MPRLYGGNVKSNALGLPGGGVIAVGFDLYIIILLKYGTRLNLNITFSMFFLLQAKCILLNNSASFQHFPSKHGQMVELV